MMKGIYSSPFRVYLVLLLLAAVGLYNGLNLPISLYPNSSKPTIWVSVPYGKLTPEEFRRSYGIRTENELQAISTDQLEVEKVSAEYRRAKVSFDIEFKWGSRPKIALREVQSLVNSLAASWPKEISDQVRVNYWSKSSGFVAISFFSEMRDLNELYNILEPIIVPPLAKVKDAEEANLWNPSKKEVRIILDTLACAQLSIFPGDIENAIRQGLSGFLAGSVVIGTDKLSIQMPRQLNNLENLQQLLVTTPKGSLVHLSEIAKIEFKEASDKNRVFKTNGAKSLILFANPRSGGNVKQMAEKILNIVKGIMPSLPNDIKYRVLVDPSEFIRSSVTNVAHEVILAAFLAVIVLFIFVGSFKNTVTAAIEIPLSMILAFILMKLTNMNINLISLGGMALAAGMNVDASVVVMDNIFRHFEKVKGPLDFSLRLNIIIRAVKEVRMPIIASTISTLVVFTPLAFTSDLTNAILGDLAKAVIFSHAFSAFIALLLVPTIRLHIMNRSTKKGEVEKIPTSPINSSLLKLESFYAKFLRQFIQSKKTQLVALISFVLCLTVLLWKVVPQLKREIVGTPDTDWMVLSVSTSGNTRIEQMESEASQLEADLLANFGEDIKYTFTQIRRANRATIMARLKDKGDMDRVWKKMEEKFQNTPTLSFWVGPWNPAELPIPNPPQMRLVVRGGDANSRTYLAENLLREIRKADAFPRTWSAPSVSHRENITLRPHLARWPNIRASGTRFTPYDLSDLTRVATEGRSIEKISIDGKNYPLYMRYPRGTISTKEDLAAMPILVNNKLIPLRAIADVTLEKAKPSIYSENGRSMIVINGRQDKGKESRAKVSLAKAKKAVANYQAKNSSTSSPIFEDAEKDLNKALKQLSVALLLSVLLIFLTILFQFGNFIHTLIIMVAIPLGIFGGVLALFAFKSTLSLNSALGIILLNGIAVNNSIILVDFIRKLAKEGMAPIEAAILAARKRLRPILITSLTTILGMLPIAFGIGEGGKILQPLGIAVTGGLWFSSIFTLFVVPLLETIHLSWKRKRGETNPQPPPPYRQKDSPSNDKSIEQAFQAIALFAITGVSSSYAAPISFNQALEEIRARDTLIPTQQKILSAAKIDLLSKKMQFLPSIKTGHTITKSYVADSEIARNSTYLSSSLNLFKGGGDLSAMNYSHFSLKAQQENLRQTKLNSEAKATTVLINYILKKNQLDINKELQKIKMSSLNTAQERFARGLTSSQEVSKAHIDLNNTKARFSDLRTKMQESSAALQALLGHNRIKTIWPWKKKLQIYKISKIAQTPQSINNNTDFQQAEIKIMLEEEALRKSERVLLPTVDFSYTFYRNSVENTKSSERVSLLTVSFPLFSGLSDYAQIEQQKASLNSARYHFSQIKRDLQSDWKSVRQNLIITIRSAKEREETSALSQKLFKDNFRRFQQGRVSINDLQVDQNRLLDSYNLAQSGWSLAHLTLLDFCHQQGLFLNKCLSNLNTRLD